jgi:hypothetical protein
MVEGNPTGLHGHGPMLATRESRPPYFEVVANMTWPRGEYRSYPKLISKMVVVGRDQEFVGRAGTGAFVARLLSRAI